MRVTARAAQHDIGILVYAALFLAEDVGLVRLLADKARAGVTVRLLLADPNFRRMAERGAEEGIGDAVADVAILGRTTGPRVGGNASQTQG